MPLPLLLLGVLSITGTIGGAVINAATRSVVDDEKQEINDINSQMESLANDVNMRYVQATEYLTREIEELDKYKEVIQRTFIQNFSDLFNQVKNMNYERFKRISPLKANYQNYNVVAHYLPAQKLEGSKMNVCKTILQIAVLSPIGSGLFLIGNIAKGVKYAYKIDEAKEKLEELKAECEQAEINILLINDTGKKCAECLDVLIVLSRLLSRLTYELEAQLRIFGFDYETLPSGVKEQLMTGCNLAGGLNRIINTQVITDDGQINPNFVSILEEVRQIAEDCE